MEQNKNLTWILVAVILGISLIGSTFIITGGIKEIKMQKNTLSVKGSAKEKIRSDLAIWVGSFNANDADRQAAYQKLQQDSKTVVEFLKSKGYTNKDITLSSVTTTPINVMLENGVYSNRVESYTLSQTVTIQSTDIDKVSEISRTSTELINMGVSFESAAPTYLYTKLAEKKIKMIEQATTDAKARAEGILRATGGRAGNLVSAAVGIFQITPLYSDDISDSGVNDTSSIEKEITAVVNCDFEVKK